MNEGTIGEVRLFAGDYAPANWAFCDGQLMAISQNEALFSILGTRYGGDGLNSFSLPKLESVGEVKYIICLEGNYPRRN